jgi:predicted RNA-binding Zn ribbon-like protein
MSAVRKQTASDWRDGFLFLGNHAALDFLNTRPAINGELVELLPDFDALLRWFQASGLLESAPAAKVKRRWGNSAQSAQVLTTLRGLRENLRRAVLAMEQGKAIPVTIVEELNKLMESHPFLCRLKPTPSRAWSLENWFRPEVPEDLLAPLAYAAAQLLAGDLTRIRKCANCVLHFLDTSKKGTRRWCSMRLCGNRSKVAAYADRQRRHDHL